MRNARRAQKNDNCQSAMRMARQKKETDRVPARTLGADARQDPHDWPQADRTGAAADGEAPRDLQRHRAGVSVARALCIP
jgi:hypothetical protein